MAQLVITAAGPDRPGLVSELTGFLTHAGLNVADSRMINLRGYFALIVLAEGLDEAIRSVQQNLAERGRSIGMNITCEPVHAGSKPFVGVPFRLRTYSMDQLGIAHRVSDLMSRLGVNIEELLTKLESAPIVGTPLFTMDMRLTVPTTVPISKLRSELQALCDSFNCDFDLDPA